MEENRKKLIINADDAGLHDAVNKAVERCYREGVITAASLMASGSAFKEAAAILRAVGQARAGVHLTLTGGSRPCVGSKNFFAGYKELFLSYIANKIDIKWVRAEFSAQIERVKKEGLSVTHLDSHEHVHVLPRILDVVIGLAKEKGIGYIRVPDEPVLVMSKCFSARDLLRYCSLKPFGVLARKKISAQGLKTSDVFWGHFHSGRLTKEVLGFFLDNLKDGVNEVCVHTACISEPFLEKYPWYRNAGREMESLIGIGARGAAAKRGIELVEPGSLT